MGHAVRWKNEAPFSTPWMVLSLVTFVGVELILGGVLGDILLRNAKSIPLRFTLQGLFHLTSFFLGGLLIGMVSPKIRIVEPAMGAFLAVGVMMVMTFFTPYTFIQFDLGKLIVGGVIAFLLAQGGARLGEKWTGSIDEDE
jgi:hypothetical protein